PLRFGTIFFTEKAPVIEIHPLKEKGWISLRVKNIKGGREELILQTTSFSAESQPTTSSLSIELSPGEERRLKFPYRKKNSFSLLIEALFPKEKQPFFRSIIPLPSPPIQKSSLK
ncbi:MAG: hypothetical protein KAX20_07910, partial [Candidatus Omnitrophica bacterium]|nr:hypothetical protein [Candidatus Omnitrophota bacterium]